MTCQYSSQDKKQMEIAAKAKNPSRLQELIDFIKISGFNKIGIANCSSMQVYADKLISILQKEGFDIYSINCKESGLQGEKISPEMSGPSCDPISQAEFLNSRQTEFNINLGLCLGHGLLFSKYSKAPVTTIVVKDPSTSHNFIANLL